MDFNKWQYTIGNIDAVLFKAIHLYEDEFCRHPRLIRKWKVRPLVWIMDIEREFAMAMKYASQQRTASKCCKM